MPLSGETLSCKFGGRVAHSNGGIFQWGAAMSGDGRLACPYQIESIQAAVHRINFE